MIKRKNGISLIVLIITIIVVIILASVIIVSINKNNPIKSAKEAKFKSDLSSFRDELEDNIKSLNENIMELIQKNIDYMTIYNQLLEIRKKNFYGFIVQINMK